MNRFWNTVHSLLAAIIFLLILNIVINQFYSINILETDNSITLAALITTVLCTLYSNYNSNEQAKEQLKFSEKQLTKQLKQNEENLKIQLLFNEKQNAYIELYSKLNEYWELFDYKRVNHLLENTDYEPETWISTETFSKIDKIISQFKFSSQYYYMSSEIQKSIDEFIEYVDINLEHYGYYKQDNSPQYWNAIEILSKTYQLLEKEIGVVENNFNAEKL